MSEHSSSLPVTATVPSGKIPSRGTIVDGLAILPSSFHNTPPAGMFAKNFLLEFGIPAKSNLSVSSADVAWINRERAEAGRLLVVALCRRALGIGA